MVYRAVTDIELVHHVHDVHHGLGVVCGIAVYLHVEDVSATGECMVRSLHLSLVQGRALVVNGHMVGVGIVVLVSNAGDDAELLLVELGKAAGKTLGRSGQNAVVMLVAVAELQHTVAHVGDYLQTQFLTLLALAVVLASEGDKALCQTNETDTQCTLVDDGGDSLVGSKVLATYPQTAHEQGELLGEGGLLELHTVVQLLRCNLQEAVQLGKEGCYAVLAVLDVHTLDGQAHDVDGREGEVTATDTGLGAETVLEHAGTATHGGTLVLVALGIVDVPLLVVVVWGVEIDEVGEETACCHLTGILVEVVVAVGGQITHAALLLPYLYGEDGSFAIAHTLVGTLKQLAYDAASLGTGVRTVVDGREHHLVATTRMYSVHIVDERLHGLVHTLHSLVDGMLAYALSAGKTGQRGLDEILYLAVVQFAVVLGIQIFQHLDFLYETLAHVWCQIEVESRNSLTAVHLVLHSLHADTAQYRSGLDTLCRTALAMTGLETVLQDSVQRMLDAGQRLGRIVILVVDVQVVVAYSLLHLIAQQIVVHERLCGLAGELHHHTGRSVGIHVGILAGDVVVLDVYYLQEDVASLCLTGNGTRTTVLNVYSGNVRTAGFHQLVFHHILDLLHGHLRLASHADAVGNLRYQLVVFSGICGKHCLTDSGRYLLLVETDNASVSFKYCLYHTGIMG